MNPQNEYKVKNTLLILSIVALSTYLFVFISDLIYRLFEGIEYSFTVYSAITTILQLGIRVILTIFPFYFYRKEKARLFMAVIFTTQAIISLLGGIITVLQLMDLAFAQQQELFYILNTVFYVVLYALVAVGLFTGFSKKVLPLVAVIIGVSSSIFNLVSTISIFEHLDTFMLGINIISNIGSLAFGGFFLVFFFQKEPFKVCEILPRPKVRPQYAVPQPQYVAPQPQYTAPQPQYVAPQPIYAAPPQQPPMVQVSPEQALWELTERYKRGLVPPAEYQAQRAALLNLLK